MTSKFRIPWAFYVIAFLLTSSMFPFSACDDIMMDGPRAAGDGEWSDNMTVTTGAGLRSPSIALANGTLHVAFLGNGLQYSRSADGGATWSDPMTLGPEGQDTPKDPAVGAEGDLVVVVWDAKKDGSTKAIYWARSMDGGRSFENSSYLSGANSKEAYQPKVMIKDGTIYLLWSDNRDDPLLEHELYFRKSLDGGDTWKSEKRVTSALKDSFNHDFEVVGDTIHIVWEDERDGPHWTYYKNSTNGGTTFGPATTICQGIEASMPNLAAEGDTVHVTWWQPSYNLYYLRSDDGGINWGTPTTIVSGADETRSEGVIEAHGTYVEFVFNQNGELHYMNSSDAGDTWTTPVLLGNGLSPTNFEGYWNPLVTNENGSFVVHNHFENTIRFRYKGLHPDLSVSPGDIAFDDPYQDGVSTVVNVTVTVHNIGVVGAWGAEVEIYEESEEPGNLLAIETLGPIGVGGQAEAHTSWIPGSSDSLLIARVNGLGPLEMSLANNVAQTQANIQNFFPVPDLGADPLTALTWENITFDGSSSFDKDGTIAFHWFDFGDGNVSDWIPEATTTHAYGNDGSYNASLKVKDDKGAESLWENVTISIANRPPRPAIELDPASGEVLTNETLNISAGPSVDLDGTIVVYSWNFGDGTNSSEREVTHGYQDDGMFTLVLSVTDDDDVTNTTSVQVTVGNRAPVAVMFMNTTSTMKGWTVHFDGLDSTDADGTIVSYRWDLGDGKTGGGASILHSYDKAGTYNISLTVTDNDGALNTTNATVTVGDEKPVAVISADRTEVSTLEFVKFDSVGSLDPDGRIGAFHWDFGDGTVSQAEAPKHSFLRAGMYTVDLTVTDDIGQNASVNMTVTVLNRLPTAEIRADVMVVDVDGMINFTGMYSKDKDGTVVSFEWDFGDGDNASGMNASHHYAKADNHTVTLTVTDDDGGEATTSIVVTVTEPFVPPPPPPIGDDDDYDQLLMIGAGMGIAVIIVAILLVLFFMRRRKKEKEGDLLSELSTEVAMDQQQYQQGDGQPEGDQYPPQEGPPQEGGDQAPGYGYGEQPPVQPEGPPPDQSMAQPPEQPVGQPPEQPPGPPPTGEQQQGPYHQEGQQQQQQQQQGPPYQQDEPQS